MHIHLIARQYKNVSSLGGGQWKSGDWVASRTRDWAGWTLYLHDTKDGPSYLGGEIVSSEIISSGDVAGRLVFQFVEDPKCVGVHTARCPSGPRTRGWGQEKKYCR